MPRQVLAVCVALGAQLAPKADLVRVGPDVCRKHRPTRKVQVARRALVDVHTRVHTLVLGQPRLLEEGLGAAVALERAAPAVLHVHVGLQVALLPEAQRAEAADERALVGVRACVTCQCVRLRKCLGADGAGVGPHGRVHLVDVLGEARAARERFEAPFAAKRPLARVHAQVLREVSLEQEVHRAHVAPVGPVGRVATPVRGELVAPAKGHGAEGARKEYRGLRGVALAVPGEARLGAEGLGAFLALVAPVLAGHGCRRLRGWFRRRTTSKACKKHVGCQVGCKPRCGCSMCSGKIKVARYNLLIMY